MTIDPVGTYGFVMYYGRNSLEFKEVTQKQYLSGAMILNIILNCYLESVSIHMSEII